MTATPKTFAAADLAAFIARALDAVGVPESDAATVARIMSQADVNGSDGHGVFRLPQYIRRIQAGGMTPTAEITIVRETAGTALIDGGNGLGHLAVSRAVETAMDKAAEIGVAWVGTRNSNHAGPAGTYARMALERDMIGIYMAVGNANHLPPWGGTEMLLSTNPIAVAIPTLEEPPVALDMATTVAAYGKVKTKAQRGETMPEGWMIDALGQPLTDPTRANEGFLLPIGGAKGYGLALVFGLLAGTLNGAAMGKDVVDFNADDTSVTNTGQMIICLDLKTYVGDVDAFKRQVDDVIRQLRASPTMPGVDAIRIPGEHAHAVREQRHRDGIPLHPALLESLAEMAAGLGIDPL